MSEPITKGRHIGVCDVIQWGESAAGDELLYIGFTIQTPPDESGGYYQTYAEEVGRGITYFAGFGDPRDGKSKGQSDFTLAALRVMGWTGDDLSELVALAAAGKLAEPVELVIEHETFEGKLNAKVKWVNRLGGSSGPIKVKKPIDDQRIKGFAAAMKAKIRAIDGGGQSAPASTSRPALPSRAAPPARQGPPPGVPAHPNAPSSNYGGFGDDSDIPF